VCRQRPELWPKVCYTKMCVERDLNCGQQHERVCKQRHEMWPRVCYKKLFIDRDLICGQQYLYEAVCRQRPELCVTVGYMNCGQQYVT